MIAIGFKICEDSAQGRHNAGEQLAFEMLSELSGTSDIKITRLKNGKPVSENAAFSISHSSTVAACAVVTDRVPPTDKYIIFDGDGERIGLDIEILKTNDEVYKKIAKKYFSSNENQMLGDAEDPSLEFLRLWTKKEAHIKCTGEGLRDIRKPLPEGIITTTVNIGEKTVILSICTK